jgi:predicted transcriptional regulator
MTNSVKADLERRLQNPEFKKEFDALESEFVIIQAMIDARKKQHLTQKELSARTGIDQADISRIETGSTNPTLRMLERLADGLDMKLELRFVPKTK